MALEHDGQRRAIPQIGPARSTPGPGLLQAFAGAGLGFSNVTRNGPSRPQLRFRRSRWVTIRRIPARPCRESAGPGAARRRTPPGVRRGQVGPGGVELQDQPLAFSLCRMIESMKSASIRLDATPRAPPSSEPPLKRGLPVIPRHELTRLSTSAKASPADGEHRVGEWKNRMAARA